LIFEYKHVQQLQKFDQTQVSTAEQLALLRAVANRLGLYDAALAIEASLDPSSGSWACHIDVDVGEEPDACVWDLDEPLSNCMYAEKGVRKEACEYWRPRVGK